MVRIKWFNLCLTNRRHRADIPLSPVEVTRLFVNLKNKKRRPQWLSYELPGFNTGAFLQNNPHIYIFRIQYKWWLFWTTFCQKQNIMTQLKGDIFSKFFLFLVLEFSQDTAISHYSQLIVRPLNCLLFTRHWQHN